MPAIRNSLTATPSATPLSWPASSVARQSTSLGTPVPEAPLEGVTEHGVIGFRFQGMFAFLTYAQVGGLGVEQVEDFFRSLPNIKEWVLGKEYHQDGGKPNP